MQNKHEDRTIAYQIISFIFLYLMIIFGISIGVTLFLFSRIMLDNAQDSTRHLAEGTIAQIEGRLDKVVAISTNILELNSMNELSTDMMDHYLHEIVFEHPEISAICFAYIPSLEGTPNLRIISHSQNKAIVQYANNTDYQYMDWFQIPYFKKKSIWTEPWFDSEGTNKFVISYCKPLFKEGKIIGVLRFDTDLSLLQSKVTPLKLKKSGYAFLISNTGTIITHPADSLIIDESIFSLAEQSEDNELRKLGRAMISGATGFFHIKGKSIFTNSWIYYAPLINNNWSLGIVIANADVMHDINLLLIIQVLVSIIIFLTISIIVYSRTQSVARPLRIYSDIAQRIGKGDFETQLPIVSKTYEIEKLTQAFAYMQASLKEYLHNLDVSNREKNRILAEVRYASEIQKNLIPSNTEFPCGRNELRAFGILYPASEIGGDLYDYFMIDDNHFCFAIADVVGKGIVAAMTMTIVSTFLRSIATYHHTAKDIMWKLNNFLCRNNIEANFVTVLLGVLNLEDGLLEFSNAGHVPMFVRKMDRTYTKYSETHSTAVGVFEELQIASEFIQLDIGDEIILFTDGISEAMNDQEEFLGVSGLETIIQTLGNPNPQKSASIILEEVHKFSKTSKEKDDITILVIDYKHPKRMDKSSYILP
ncbi:MAG: SpoIIE family protein phosphatase [Candidatus Cloacimonetes bacterium]|nr:SpoIIE family protein phosphatase [Candidatus Cloacimonadota bacterium]